MTGGGRRVACMRSCRIARTVQQAGESKRSSPMRTSTRIRSSRFEARLRHQRRRPRRTSAGLRGTALAGCPSGNAEAAGGCSGEFAKKGPQNAEHRTCSCGSLKEMQVLTESEARPAVPPAPVQDRAVGWLYAVLEMARLGGANCSVHRCWCSNMPESAGRRRLRPRGACARSTANAETSSPGGPAPAGQ